MNIARLSLSILLLIIVGTQTMANKNEKAMVALAERIMPEQAALMQFEQLPASETKDVFSHFNAN